MHSILFRISNKVALLLLALMLFTQLAFAHGSGVSFEEIKDGYKVDIGHDEFIAALESTRFDFNIFPENLESIEGEVFTDVWVTVTRDKKLFFAGGVHKPTFGTTGFTYVFPEEGMYTISARFQKEGETVVQSEFTLGVIPPLEEKKEMPTLLLALLCGGAGFFSGIALGLFIPRNNKKTA